MRIHRPHRILGSAVLVMALGAGLMSVAAAQTSAPYVRVFVDGSPVSFDQAPAIANGRVLVPLRGVFERLGATVGWDPASQTVLAQRGATSVSLRIGSPQAFVNGQAQLMDVPALLVGGRTLVPLRFVSQALGADVNWDAATSAVQIASQGALSIPPSQNFPPAPPIQAQPPAPAPQPTVQTITGTVVRVNAAAYPGQLILQTPSGVYTYQVVSGTSITRMNAVTGVTGPVSLSAIRLGDMVQVTADQAGTAQSIQASFAEITGTIASTGYNQIMLQNGQVYPLSPSVQVTRQSVAVSAAALQPGDVVSLRLDPQTNQVTSITVQQAAAAPGAITSQISGRLMAVSTGQNPVIVVRSSDGQDHTIGVAADTAIFRYNADNNSGGSAPLGALRAGDQATVVVNGANQARRITANYHVVAAGRIARVNAGTRTVVLANGQAYVVRPDAIITLNGQNADFSAIQNGRVAGFSVISGTNEAYEVRVATPTAAAPPASVIAPTITAPGNGVTVGTTFTVQGTASPGARVQVTAQPRLLGQAAQATTTADARGRWAVNVSVTSLPLVSFPYVISVVQIVNGMQSDAASIEVNAH